MTLTREDAIAIIYAELEKMNAEKGRVTPLPVASDTKLLGSERALDSIDFVNLILALEEALATRLKKSITLLDENAYTDHAFRDVSSLADHIVRLSA